MGMILTKPRYLGVVMKAHKGLVDARMVKQMIEETLGLGGRPVRW